MSGTSFDSIAHAILTQKQMMDELQAENRELRQQLADLRAGHGIFIELGGMRIPLRGEIAAAETTNVTSVLSQNISSSPPSFSMPKGEISSMVGNEDVAELTPTQELSLAEEAPIEKEEPEKTPTFLEEIMIDEFVTASTSPMAVWQVPVKKSQQEPIDEEQKAALRRELMGSFLLE
jgi:hypothetical protein